MFSFLKKKELAEIASLNAQLANALQTIDTMKYVELAEIAALKAQIKALEKYRHIANVDEEVANRLAKCKENEDIAEQRIADLELKYKAGYSTYLLLQGRIDAFRETLKLSEFGVYEPHFNFDKPESYKVAITEVRERQKALIKSQSAAIGGDNMHWNDSRRYGKIFTNRMKRAILRAFNGECDSFIASVNWNNIQRLEERINSSFEAINKLYKDFGAVVISRSYKDLKLEELRLAYEYELKKHEEKEEQRAIRDLAREEEKVQRDIETAKLKAEKEEALYLKAIEKVKKDMGLVSPEKQQELLNQIAELEDKLKSVEADRQRALSMAQQTRRGYVYIISNIGSFGENIYKIGMTRRLEPMDRIRELGDASVPFQFDVHAIILCEDAPTLENALHKSFEHKRLNRINMRREFFNCSLDEIEAAIEKHHGKIECIKIPEAQQYRESLAISEQHKLTPGTGDQAIFSEELFAN